MNSINVWREEIVAPHVAVADGATAEPGMSAGEVELSQDS